MARGRIARQQTRTSVPALNDATRVASPSERFEGDHIDSEPIMRCRSSNVSRVFRIAHAWVSTRTRCARARLTPAMPGF